MGILNRLLEELTNFNCNISKQVTNYTHFSIEQVAETMNCSPATVRQWIKDGEIKAFKHAGTLRVRSINLERFITRHTF